MLVILWIAGVFLCSVIGRAAFLDYRDIQNNKKVPEPTTVELEALLDKEIEDTRKFLRQDEAAFLTEFKKLEPPSKGTFIDPTCMRPFQYDPMTKERVYKDRIYSEIAKHIGDKEKQEQYNKKGRYGYY